MLVDGVDFGVEFAAVHSSLEACSRYWWASYHKWTFVAYLSFSCMCDPSSLHPDAHVINCISTCLHVRGLFFVLPLLLFIRFEFFLLPHNLHLFLLISVSWRDWRKEILCAHIYQLCCWNCFWSLCYIFAVFQTVYIVHMKKYCDHEKKYSLLILMDLVVFSSHDYGKVFFGMPSVCLYLYLAKVWTVVQILFIFGIWEFMHTKSVPGECEHSSSKNRDPSDGPQSTKWRVS
jgi:hypothetical protein